MSEKVLRCEVIRHSENVIGNFGGHLDVSVFCDFVFDEGEKVVVIPEEEYDRLCKVEKAARILDEQVAKAFEVR